MDFMSARVADGWWFRILTVVDQFTRECVGLVANQSLTGEKVAGVGINCHAARGASLDHRGQWQRIRQSRHGRLGLPTRHSVGHYSTGETS